MENDKYVAVGLVAFMSFCTNEEGYPFETSFDEKKFLFFRDN